MEKSEQINKLTPKPDMFQCKVCPYNTLRRPFLDKHMQQKHGFSKIKPESPPGKKRAHLKRKVKTLLKQSEANDRVEFESEMIDFKTDNLCSNKQQPETEMMEEWEIYQCTQCDFKTSEVNALKVHESTHKRLELFQCPDCDYASTHRSNFKAHVRNHADPDQPEMFSCKFCNDFTTDHKSSLFKHIGLDHKGLQKIFECKQCPYVTPNKSHMAAHQNVHIDPADLPTYRCDICDLETHNEVTIRKHVNKHREREQRGEELIVKEIDGFTQLVWFCCDLCEFRSKNQRYVILHKKVHARADEINRMGQEIVFGKNKDVENGLGNDEKEYQS